MAGNREIPAADSAAFFGAPAGELLKEGAQAALYAAFEEPARGAAQLFASGVNSVVKKAHLTDNSASGVRSGHWLPKVDLFDAPVTARSASQEWAQTIGSAAGQLLPLMAIGALTKGVSTKIFAEREGLLLNRSRAIGFSLGEAAVTGFVNDAVLKESDPTKNIVGARLLNGIGGAITFTAMTAGSLLLDGAAARMTAAPRVAGLLRNRVLSGAISGVPGAVLGAEYDSFVKTGHRASGPQLGKAATQMAVIGGLFGAKESLSTMIGFKAAFLEKPVNEVTAAAAGKLIADKEKPELNEPAAKITDQPNSASDQKTEKVTARSPQPEIRTREKQGWNSDVVTLDRLKIATEVCDAARAKPNAAGTPVTLEQAQALHTLTKRAQSEQAELTELKVQLEASPDASALQAKQAELQRTNDQHVAELKDFAAAVGGGDAQSHFIVSRIIAPREAGATDPYHGFSDNDSAPRTLHWLQSRAASVEAAKDALQKRSAENPPRVRNATTGEWQKMDAELSNLELALMAEVTIDGLPEDRQSYQHLRGRGVAADTLIQLATANQVNLRDLWRGEELGQSDHVHKLWQNLQPFVSARASLRELEADQPKRASKPALDQLSDAEIVNLYALRELFQQDAQRMKELLSRRGPISETTARLAAVKPHYSSSHLIPAAAKARLMPDATITGFRLSAQASAQALDLANRRVYELDEVKEKRADDISAEELNAYSTLRSYQPRDHGITETFATTLKARGPHSTDLLAMLDSDDEMYGRFDEANKERLMQAIQLKEAIAKLAPEAQKAFPPSLFELTGRWDMEITSQSEADRFAKLYAAMRDPNARTPDSASDFWLHGPNVPNAITMSKWGNLDGLNQRELEAIPEHMQAALDEDKERWLSPPFDGAGVSSNELQTAARAWQVARTMPFAVAKEVGALPLEKRIVAAAAWEDIRERSISYDFLDDGRLLASLNEQQLSYAKTFISDFWQRYAEIQKDGRKQAVSRLKQLSALRPAIDTIHPPAATADSPASPKSLTVEQRDQFARAIEALGTPARFDLVSSIATSSYQDALRAFTEMEPIFAERNGKDGQDAGSAKLSAAQRLQFPLRLAVNFKGSSPEWLAKQLADGRSLHDATYWLPLDVSPNMKGLSRYLLRYPNGKLPDLELIANRWSEVPEDQRRNNPKMVAQLLREKKFPTVTDSAFAAEAARAGITDDQYPDLESRYKDSLKVSSPFPQNIVWRCGDLQGRFLPRDDARGLFLGIYTNSCQHPEGAGADSAWHGQENPRGGFFVVEDKRGDIVAESWVWIADNGALVFDNVEAKGMGTRMGAAQGVYQAAADDLEKEYGLVLLGTNNSDINVAGLADAGDKKAKMPSQYLGYSDAHDQVILAGDKPSAKHALADAGKTEAVS